MVEKVHIAAPLWSSWFQWVKLYPKLTLLLSFIWMIVFLNLLAFLHAYKMTHFSQKGLKTPKPEALSLLQKIKVLFAGVNIPRPQNSPIPGDLERFSEVHRFKGHDAIELEAWYFPHPRSRGLILMFHGYANCKTSLLSEAKAFREMGYSTFLVDFHGSGGSDGNKTSIGYYEAEDVKKTMEYIRTFPVNRPLILYGQSMGSVAILRAIHLYGLQPQALILESPFDKMLSTAENRFSGMGLPAFPAAHLLIFWGSIQQGFWGFKHNPKEYAKRVRCPTLLLYGKEDSTITGDQIQALFENLKVDKQLEILRGVRHESSFRASPDIWKSVVSRFLAKYG